MSTPLAELFEQMRWRYRELRDRIAPTVVRWECSRNNAYDLQPFHNERHGWPPARVFGSDPGKNSWTEAYGFDSQDRLAIEIQPAGSPQHQYETFFLHEPDTIVTAHFDYHPEKKLINVVRAHYTQGRIVAWEMHATEGAGEETYEYAGDRLIRIVHRHRRLGAAESGRSMSTYDVEYDERGKPRLITHTRSGSAPAVVFRQIPRALTGAQIGKRIEERLISVLPEMVAAAHIAEPVYCLALLYDPAEMRQMLPMEIALGLDSKRRQWRRDHGERAKDFVWNPAEFGTIGMPELRLSDADLLRDCDLMNHKMVALESVDAAYRMLNRAAQRLSTLDWSGRMPTTPDFLAFAVDLEGIDLEANLKKSLPAARLARLRAEGWL